jgi:hypothetical protein
MSIEEIKDKLTYHLWNDGFYDEEQLRQIHPEFLEMDYPEIHEGLEALEAEGLTQKGIRDWLREILEKIYNKEVDYEIEYVEGQKVIRKITRNF